MNTLKGRKINWRENMKILERKYENIRLDNAYESIYEYNEKQNAYMYAFSYYQAGINKHDSEYKQLVSLDTYLRSQNNE